MHRVTLILTFLFSLMFSSPSYSEWTKVGDSVGGGDTYYVDYERIRKHGGYVYWWTLGDYLKPTSTGILSYKKYKQGDCKLFRYKILSGSFHKEPMGGGTGKSANIENPKWTYPPPNFVTETALLSVCSR